MEHDDYPPNIAEASKYLAACLVLILAPETIDVNKLLVISNIIADDEIDDKGIIHTMTIKFRLG